MKKKCFDVSFLVNFHLRRNIFESVSAEHEFKGILSIWDLDEYLEYQYFSCSHFGLKWMKVSNSFIFSLYFPSRCIMSFFAFLKFARTSSLLWKNQFDISINPYGRAVSLSQVKGQHIYFSSFTIYLLHPYVIKNDKWSIRLTISCETQM